MAALPLGSRMRTPPRSRSRRSALRRSAEHRGPMHFSRPLSLVLATLALALSILPATAFALAPPSYVTQWGSLGAAPGLFNQPNGVATDGAGFVYVTDGVNNRVQKFTT